MRRALLCIVRSTGRACACQIREIPSAVHPIESQVYPPFRLLLFRQRYVLKIINYF